MSKFPACGQHQLCYQSAPGPSSSISTGSANCRQKETSLGSCCHDQRIWKFRRYSIYKIVCKTKPHLSPPPPNSSPFSLAVVAGRRDSLSVPSWPSSQTSQAFCSRAPPELSGPALTCCPGYPQPTKPRQESTMTGKLRERNETYSRNGNLPSWSREFRNQCLSPKATSDPHKGLLKPRGPQLWSPSSSFEQHNRLHKPNIAQVVKTLPKRDQTVVLIRPPPEKSVAWGFFPPPDFWRSMSFSIPPHFFTSFLNGEGGCPCVVGVCMRACAWKRFISFLLPYMWPEP